MLFIENPKEYQTITFYSHFRAVEQRNLRKTRMASDKTTARICRQETFSNSILAAGPCPGSAEPRLASIASRILSLLQSLRPAAESRVPSASTRGGVAFPWAYAGVRLRSRFPGAAC